MFDAPVLAWVDEQVWNWTCDDCGQLTLCEHVVPDPDSPPHGAAAVEDVGNALLILKRLVDGHQSSVAVVEALGGDPCRETESFCLKCEQVWPCPTVVQLEKAAAPVIERWREERGVLPMPAPSSLLRRDHQFEHVASDGVVRCPRCGVNVSDGIEEWRQEVSAAFRFLMRAEERIVTSIDRKAIDVERSFRSAENDGLRLASSHLRAEFNRLLFAHHEHLTFVLAERDAGLIDRHIVI